MANQTSSKIDVIFLSFVGPNYSRSSTLLNFESSAFQKSYFQLPTGLMNFTYKIFQNRHALRSASCIVIMSPCHMLTPVVKLLTRKPLILDAGWALTDGLISRGLTPSRIFTLPLTILIDFIAFLFADIVLLESQAQAHRVRRMLGVPKSKIKVLFTGLNETSFSSKSVQSKLITDLKNRIEKLNFPITILFRGKINREAGFENILSAAHQLRDQAAFIFVVGNKDIDRKFPINCITLSEISDDEMKHIYLLADIALGQISSHPRLKYTIPHKAYEAGFFAITYVTSDSEGIREFLNSDSAFLLKEPFPESLVEAVSDLRNLELRTKYAKNIHQKYMEVASQSILNERFEEITAQLLMTKARRSR